MQLQEARMIKAIAKAVTKSVTRDVAASVTKSVTKNVTAAVTKSMKTEVASQITSVLDAKVMPKFAELEAKVMPKLAELESNQNRLIDTVLTMKDEMATKSHLKAVDVRLTATLAEHGATLARLDAERTVTSARLDRIERSYGIPA